jgi:hypothetical protein
MTSSPPKITDGKIELFGRKGKETYRVKQINFHHCKYMDGRCMHDIFMIYEDNLSSYCFSIHDVSYEELVRQNYLPYYKKSSGAYLATELDMKILESSFYPCCKLLNRGELMDEV